MWIHNGDIQIRDATNVWGKSVTESQQTIRDELGDRDTKILTDSLDQQLACADHSIYGEYLQHLLTQAILCPSAR